MVPNGRTLLFSKNHIGVTVYLLNSLLLGISSHGYVKDISLFFGYNNFNGNIGLALFKTAIRPVIGLLGDSGSHNHAFCTLLINGRTG